VDTSACPRSRIATTCPAIGSFPAMLLVENHDECAGCSG
jgi:hypothetical protein